ncbi:MAG: NAD(P)H-dependent oxidoreductase subunit E [Dehalococcoidia bacterium]
MDREDIKEVLGKFPRERTYLLPALQAVQEEVRYLPAWAMEEVSAYLKVPKSEVHGVASSYPELRLKEPGKHIVRVCTGLSCFLNGAIPVLEELKKSLALQPGETAPTGMFTLEEMPCAFVCPLSPAVEWDGECMGRMTLENAVAKVKAMTAHNGEPR